MKTNKKLQGVFQLLMIATILGLTLHSCSETKEEIIDEGEFLVHRRQSHIGAEQFTVTKTAKGLVVKSLQGENERGRITGVEAELRLNKKFQPVYYHNQRIANSDTINKLSFRTEGGNAYVRELFFEESVEETPEIYFPLHSHVPAAIEMMLYEYYFKMGKPKAIKTFPRGEVKIEYRGDDKTTIGGKEITLERYVVYGVNWGGRTIWVDKDHKLIAVVKANTQIRELIRKGYEEALPLFIKGNVEEQMDQLNTYTENHKKPQAPIKALVNVNLVDGLKDETRKNMSIIIQNGLIKKIGKSSELTVPTDAKVYDLEGKTVIPGLWDMHSHSNQVQWAPAYLAGGVTTVRCNGNEIELATAFRDAIYEGKLGPELLLTGMTDGKGITGNGVIRARTPEEAYEVANMYYDLGYKQIKCYQQLEPEIVKILCDEAHRMGITAAGHVSTPCGNARVSAEMGLDLLSHAFPFLSVLYPDKDRSELGRYFLTRFDLTDEMIEDATQFYLKHDVALDPTIAIYVLRNLPLATPLETIDPDIVRLPYELWEEKRFLRGVPAEKAEMVKEEVKMAMEVIHHFHQAGIPIVAGPDNVVPVTSCYVELETYVNYGGFSPFEALRTATSIPAEVMGMSDLTGTLEVGKQADIAILDKNPLEDISNIRTVSAVVNNGQYYESNPLWLEAGYKARTN